MSAVAERMREIVRSAAMPVAPGDSIKAQINRAWSQLGRPPLWRVTAAWKGLGGSWSAAAAYDFEDRFTKLIARRGRAARDKDIVHANRLEAAATALETLDADSRGTEAAQLRDLARCLRHMARNRRADLGGGDG